MKITSDENVNQAVEQMVQAIRNTDAYLEYQKQLARVKEQPELKGNHCPPHGRFRRYTGVPFGSDDED